MGLIDKLPVGPKCRTKASGLKLLLRTATIKRRNIDCDLRGNDHFHGVFFQNDSLTPTEVSVYRTSRHDCIEYDKSQSDPNGCTKPTAPSYDAGRQDRLQVPAGKCSPVGRNQRGEREHCININVCDDSRQTENVVVEVSYDDGSFTAEFEVNLAQKKSIP